MVINFSDLLSKKNRKKQISLTFELETFEFEGEEIRAIEKVDVEGVAISENDVIVINASIKTKLQLSCSRCLEELEKDFIITHNKQNAFAMLGYFQLAKGKIIIKEGGYGFVDGELFNVHIGKGKTLTALPGDIVLVRFYDYNGTNYEGEVVRVIERKWDEVVGTLIKRKNKYYVKRRKLLNG